VSAAREPLREAVIDGKRQWWTATMEWKAGRERIVLLMSSVLMQQLVPVEAKGGGAKLATRRTAIVDESVRVEAVLGDATVSVEIWRRLPSTMSSCCRRAVATQSFDYG